LNFLDRVSQNTQISNFMTIRPVGAELFHADRDMTVAFGNFVNAPKKILNLRKTTRSSHKTNKKPIAANNNNVS